jgi:hypothetical protein
MDNLIGRKVRRELQVELPDGSAGTEVLVGTVTSYRYGIFPQAREMTMVSWIVLPAHGLCAPLTPDVCCRSTSAAHAHLLPRTIPSIASTSVGGAASPNSSERADYTGDGSETRTDRERRRWACDTMRYSRESTYYEVDYNDGGEPEEFTREELIPMLVPQPPPRPGGSGDGRAGSAAGAMVAGGGSRGGSSGSTSAAAQLGGTLRTPSPGGYMTEMELRAGVSAEVAAMERLIGRKVKHTVTRRVEGPGGGGSDETFEALGFVSLYSPANDLFTVEFEDGGEETFSPTALDRILMPEEVRVQPESPSSLGEARGRAQLSAYGAHGACQPLPELTSVCSTNKRRITFFLLSHLLHSPRHAVCETFCELQRMFAPRRTRAERLGMLRSADWNDPLWASMRTDGAHRGGAARGARGGAS